MNGNVSKVIAATAAASLACEVPLPALVDEVAVSYTHLTLPTIA